MRHQFSMTAVEKWARFSGDFNPIHFDLSYARLLGEERLIVHGMLAAMPFKQGMWRQYKELGGESGNWIKFRTLFRKPLAHDDVVVLTPIPGRVLSFRINEETTGHEHFRGSCSAAAVPLPAMQPGLVDPVTSPLPLDRLEAFMTAYPEIPEPWIALDAVIFSEFMRTRVHEIYAIVRQNDPSSILGGVGTQQVIVHSSHTVNFDVEFFSSCRDFSWASLTYGLSDPDFIWSDNRVVCTVPIWVRLRERNVMLVEIGVVAIFNQTQ